MSVERVQVVQRRVAEGIFLRVAVIEHSMDRELSKGRPRADGGKGGEGRLRRLEGNDRERRMVGIVARAAGRVRLA